MKIFVTGATGFVGSAVVENLIKAGHEVTGLARNEANAKSLIAVGAKVHKGDLEDLDSLKSGAAASDGVIHTGFIHDFARFKEVCEVDRHAILALGSALIGSDRPLIVTSGVAVVSPGKMATEDTPAPSATVAVPRVSEEVANSLASRGVRTSIVRLSPTTHGEGDHGFVPILVNLARSSGVSVYIEEGMNRWPAVHRHDAAQIYRLAIEKATSGSRFHAVAEEGVAFKEIAQAIGKHLNIPVVSMSREEAVKHFGWFVHFAGIDCPASSKLTREILGWKPTHSTLLEDLNSGSYFR